MSNIGKPERQLWYEMKSNPREVAISAPTMIKFLYGHILERVVLFLTELSGHEVTDEQKEVKVEGVVGHMDCKIDGEVVDIKSASNFAFKKFSEGTLPENDVFGYLSQLAGTFRRSGQQCCIPWIVRARRHRDGHETYRWGPSESWITR